MQKHSLDELIYHMRTIARTADSEWERGFAASVLKQSRRAKWKPSAKQIKIMRNLVDDLFGPDLIDNEGGFGAA